MVEIRARGFSDGTGNMADLQPARAFGQPTGGQRLDFQTGSATPTSAPYTFESNYSVFNGTEDPTAGWGYNNGYSNNKVVPNEPTMRHLIEGNYDRGTDKVMEQYWEAISADSNIQWRPVFAMADRSGSGTSRTTFIDALDFTGPAPNAPSGTQGIRFFSAKDGPSMQSDEQTYLFSRANMQIKGFSDSNTTLNVSSGKTSVLQLGSQGVDGIVSLTAAGKNVGILAVGGTGSAAQMWTTAINGNKAITVGLNVGSRSSAVLDVGLTGTWSDEVGIRVSQQAGGTGNLLQTQDSAGAIRSGFDKGGTIFTQVNAAPADADLAVGEADMWYDSSGGSSRLMVKARDASGNIVSGSVQLSSSTSGLVTGSQTYDPVDGANVLALGSGNDTVTGLDTANIIFGGAGNDAITGGNANDILFGGLGDDTLIGGGGNDVIWGDGGNDTLIGGSGADTYQFAQASGADLITGFNQPEGDRLGLNGQSYTTGNDGQGHLQLNLSGGGTVGFSDIAAGTTVNPNWFA